MKTATPKAVALGAAVLSVSILAGCSASDVTWWMQALTPEAPREPVERPVVAPSPKVEPVPTPKPPKAPRRSVTGTASTYGPGYGGLFALPARLGGRGERVRVCNLLTRRCIVRTSNDVGPVARLHRVADLNVRDFEYLCRCDWHRGVQKVRITWQ